MYILHNFANLQHVRTATWTCDVKCLSWAAPDRLHLPHVAYMIWGLENGLVTNHAEFQSNRPIGEWESMNQCMGKNDNESTADQVQKGMDTWHYHKHANVHPKKIKEMIGLW